MIEGPGGPGRLPNEGQNGLSSPHQCQPGGSPIYPRPCHLQPRVGSGPSFRPSFAPKGPGAGGERALRRPPDRWRRHPVPRPPRQAPRSARSLPLTAGEQRPAQTPATGARRPSARGRRQRRTGAGWSASRGATRPPPGPANAAPEGAASPGRRGAAGRGGAAGAGGGQGRGGGGRAAASGRPARPTRASLLRPGRRQTGRPRARAAWGSRAAGSSGCCSCSRLPVRGSSSVCTPRQWRGTRGPGPEPGRGCGAVPPGGGAGDAQGTRGAPSPGPSVHRPRRPPWGGSQRGLGPRPFVPRASTRATNLRLPGPTASARVREGPRPLRTGHPPPPKPRGFIPSGRDSKHFLLSRFGWVV